MTPNPMARISIGYFGPPRVENHEKNTHQKKTIVEPIMILIVLFFIYHYSSYATCITFLPCFGTVWAQDVRRILNNLTLSSRRRSDFYKILRG